MRWAIDHWLGFQNCSIRSRSSGALFLLTALLTIHAPRSWSSQFEPEITITSNNLTSRIALGKKLFFDKRLSRDGTISCSTCHIPEKSFADGLAVAKGIGGNSGVRNTPSLLNVKFNTSQFWDGRRDTLEQQVRDPLLNPQEHGFESDEEVLTVVRGIPEYQAYFRNPPREIAMRDLMSAIAAYERTLISMNSPFDRYYYDDEKALSEAAKRGLKLFTGEAKCVECHHLDEEEALFTDHQFHSIQFAAQKIDGDLSELAMRIARMSLDERSKVVVLDKDMAALGRFIVTTDPKDIGSFKTPSLRNVAKTAPYMHDGSVVSLTEAVNREVRYRQRQSSKIFVLTVGESKDLVAFLESLSDD